MNSHFETATTYMGAVTIAADDAEDRRLTMDAAQIEATLALAYEQARAAEAAETANLIAYLNLAMADRSGCVTLAYSVPLETLKSMQAQIDERLGLA